MGRLELLARGWFGGQHHTDGSWRNCWFLCEGSGCWCGNLRLAKEVGSTVARRKDLCLRVALRLQRWYHPEGRLWLFNMLFVRGQGRPLHNWGRFFHHAVFSNSVAAVQLLVNALVVLYVLLNAAKSLAGSTQRR